MQQLIDNPPYRSWPSHHAGHDLRIWMLWGKMPPDWLRLTSAPAATVVLSADYRLPPERRWVLTAPIVSTLDVDTPVAVQLQPGDPVKGFIRADEVTRTYAPWLTGSVGMVTVATLDALRTEMDL